MPFKTGFRRPRFADTTKTWVDRFESTYAADHPKYPSRYHTYLRYIAFLTAGTIEHHWAEAAKPDGSTPFVPLGRAEDFLPDLHKKMRAFRETRYVNGFSSSELLTGSYELLDFLVERVPGDAMDRFLAIARTYIMQNEDTCLAA
jgi:hypothetical protein